MTKFTLKTLVLQTLKRGAPHGDPIAQSIQQTSEDVLQVEECSLYFFLPVSMNPDDYGWDDDYGLGQVETCPTYAKFHS